MKCTYLKTYNGASGTWSVHACCARRSPYVPSLSEIDAYCHTSHSQGCSHGRRFALRQGPAAVSFGELRGS